MSTQLSEFTYGDIALSQTVLINGIPYVTRTGIGQWLEYADPQRQVAKIIERNPDFDKYSVVVKLTTTDGKNYETFVYHPIGFLLIVMESGQPKAKEKKVEVAEFVWHFSNPGSEKLTAREKRAIRARVSTLVMQMSKTYDALVLSLLWAEVRALCDSINLDHPDLALLGKDCRQISIPDFKMPSVA